MKLETIMTVTPGYKPPEVGAFLIQVSYETIEHFGPFSYARIRLVKVAQHLIWEQTF